MSPAVLTKVHFNVDLPEDDILQVSTLVSHYSYHTIPNKLHKRHRHTRIIVKTIFAV